MRGRTTAAGVRSVGAVVLTVVVGLLLTQGQAAAAPTDWSAGSALQVERVTVRADGTRDSVRLAWPSPEGAVDSFVIRREGVIVGTVAGTARAFTDTAPDTGAAARTYTVTAVLAGAPGPGLGAPDVAFPATETGCTLVWTGGASAAWEDPANWAPYGTAGNEGPVRAPGAADHACVDHNLNLPMTVTDAGSVVERITATALRPETLRVTSGDLKVLGPARIPALIMAGGTLQLQGDTELDDASGRDALTLAGGTLVIDTTVDIVNRATGLIDGEVVVAAGTTTTLDGGAINVVQLRLNVAGAKALVGRGGHVLTASAVTSSAGTTTLTAATGGASLRTGELDVANGTTTIGWSLGAPPDPARLLLDINNGAILDVADLAGVSPPGDTVLETTDVDLAGTLVLAENVTGMDGTLRVQTDAAVWRSGGRTAAFAGLRSLGELEVTAPIRMGFDGDLTLNRLSASEEADITVDGELKVPDAFDNVVFLANATLRLTAPSRLPELVTLRVRDRVDIHGDLTVAGTLDAAFEADVTARVAVTFHDDLTLEPTTRTILTALGPDGDGFGYSSLTVLGQLTIDGTLETSLVNLFEPGTDLHVITTVTPPVGSFDLVELGGEGSDTFEVLIKDDGVHLEGGSGGGGGGDCADVPDVNGMAVQGCWEDLGSGEQFVTRADLVGAAPQKPAIGGVRFVPAADVSLVLDLSGPAPTLVATDGRGDPGLVTVAAAVAPASGPVEALGLGTVVVDWVLDGTPARITPSHAAGLPVVGTPTISATTTWRLAIDARLPGVFDRLVVPLRPSAGGSFDLATSRPLVPFADLTGLADTEVTYAGGQVWTLTGTAADGAVVAAELAYDSGTLDTASVTVSDLSPGGLGVVDAELAYDPTSSSWRSAALAGDGQPAVILTEQAGSGGLAPGSRVVLGTLELGLATLDARFGLSRVVGGWEPVGNAVVLGAGTPVQSRDPLRFDSAGALVGGSFEVAGAYGTLGEIARLGLSAPAANPPAGLDRDATAYDLSGSLTSAGVTTAVTGQLALAGGAVVHLELPLSVALGDLGTLAGVLRFDPETGRFPLQGATPDTKAAFTCDGVGRDATADVALAGGALAGAIVVPELCFGPFGLGGARLAFDAATRTFTLTASVGGAGVTGALELDAGDLVGGSIGLAPLDLGGWLSLPTVTLLHKDVAGTDSFELAGGPTGLVRELRFDFDDGLLTAGTIALGDAASGGPDVAPAVSDAGGWLPVGGVTIAYDLVRETWLVNGFLDRPAVAFDGTVDFDGGRIVAGALDMNRVDLGSLGQLDLALTVEAAGRFTVDGTLVGPAFADGRAVTGALEFSGGDLVAGTLLLATYPIGELAVIDDLELVFAGTGWDLSGTVSTADGTSAVSGSASFAAGDLVALSLLVADLPFGPSVLDRLGLVLDRSAGTDVYAIDGLVRGPATGAAGRGAASLVAFSGEAELAAGELIRFEATVPYLEIGGLAYLTDVAVAYTTSTGSATLAGTGQLVTADEATTAAASFTASVSDGALRTARVQAAGASFGGLISVTDLLMTYDAATTMTCAGDTDDLRRAAVYSIQGALSGGGQLSGCMALAGRRLVGGSLAVDQLTVGDLVTIDDFAATYASQRSTTADLTDAAGQPVPGGATLTSTTFDVTASVAAGAGAPVAVTGSIAFSDGGLSELTLALPRVPLSATVELRNLDLAYAQPSRWDGTSDTTFSLAGDAFHSGGTTAASGSLTFTADGSFEAASLEVTDLPFGPVEITELRFSFDGGPTQTWALGGQLTMPDGTTSIVDGTATIRDARLQAATLRIPALSIGDLVVLNDAGFTFTRNPDGSERWFATTTVGGLGQGVTPATATFEIVIAPDGSVRFGEVEVERVSWGGLFTVSELRLALERLGPDQLQWNLDADVAVGGGATASVSGFLVLDAGAVTAGELSLGGVRIGELATIDQIDLVAARLPGVTRWAATVTVTPGGGSPVTSTGEFVWLGGELDRANLTLGQLDVAELFSLQDAELAYQSGRRWAASGQVVDDDGTSGFAGELVFANGELVGGGLELLGLQLGPLELSRFALAVDATGAAVADTCGVADPAGAGTRFRVDATVTSADGDTTTLAGRFRLRDGAFVEGVLCGDGIQVADLFLLDDVLVAYAITGTGTSRTATFTGSATVANPDEPANPATATVSFAVADRRLARFDLSAGGLNLGELLTLDDVELHYDRTTDATDWNLAATLVRPGPDDTQITGALEVADGVVVGGSLAVADLPVGDLFTLTDVEFAYFGRRATTNPANPVGASPGGTTDCSAVPADGNVPAGTPGSTGGEAVFVASATVEANGDTFAARGSLSVADGRLTMLDISLACVPIGDFKRLEGVRVAYRATHFSVAGRLQDPDGSSLFFGQLVFDDGALAGGELVLNDVPLGIVQLDTFRLALGENPNGDTTFGLTVVVTDDDGNDLGGGGSITLRDGRLVAGSLTIERLPFLDIFTIEDFEITVDGSVTNRTSFTGSAAVLLSDGARASMAISLTTENGRIVAGSFEADQIDLFEVVPLGSFSISYDGTTSPPSWSGSLEARLPGVGGGAGPGLQLGVEFRRGKLISGVFGFDANGDGEVDGVGGEPAPASGGGDFAGLPLKALYLRYCAPDSTAAFCDPLDADTWEGRIGFELPTDGAPGLDASILIRNGRFAAASVQVQGLSIPVYPGVFLNALRGAIELDPRLSFAAGLGLTVGLPSGTFDVVAIDADLQFSEEPDPDPNLPASAYVPEYLRFYTIGAASLLELPLDLTSWVDLRTNGFVGVGGEITFELIDKVLFVNGGAEGYVFNAGALGLTNPRTGEPLTGPGVQMRGFTEASILGFTIASAEFVANTIGAMGCAEVLGGLKKVGAGIYWSDGETRLTCDLGEFEIAGLQSGEPIFTQSANRGRRSTEPLAPTAAAPVQFATFDVAPGEELLGVEVEGVGGAPDVVLIAPDGARFVEDDNDPSDGSLVATGAGKRWFVIAEPKPGTWRVEARPGSLPIAEVVTSRALPDVAVTAEVVPAGGGYELGWTATDIAGQEIVFIERSVDPADGFTATIGSGRGASGRFSFTPAGSATGGPRKIVAQVLQDGFLRAEVELATVEVPDAVPAGAPTNVAATETASGVNVTWAPPASNGGRAITSYKVSSNAGWSVTTEASGASAFLPIPGMVPGEQVPVIVQARTGLGWGEPAVVYVTSTQTTGLQFGQGEVPDTDGGGGGTDPPVVVLVLGDEEPDRRDLPLVAIVEDLGWEAVVVADDAADLRAAVLAAEPDVVFVSSTVKARKVGDALAELSVPIVNAEHALADELRLVRSQRDAVRTGARRTLRIVDAGHPLAAGLSGDVTVSTSATRLNAIRPAGAAHVVARVSAGSNQVTIAGWEAGASLASGTAPARRVALFPTPQTSRRLSTEGAALIRSALQWAAGTGPVDPPPVPTVLFVAGSAPAPAADAVYLDRLGAAGYDVTVIDDDAALASVDLADVEAVFISASVDAAKVRGVFAGAAVPVVTWEDRILDDMALGRGGTTNNRQTAVTVLAAGHPLAGGLGTGDHVVYTVRGRLVHGRAGSGATVVAHVPGRSRDAVLYEYDLGDPLTDGRPAPARRIVFFADDAASANLTPTGVQLLDAVIARIGSG